MRTRRAGIAAITWVLLATLTLSPAHAAEPIDLATDLEIERSVPPEEAFIEPVASPSQVLEEDQPAISSGAALDASPAPVATSSQSEAIAIDEFEDEVSASGVESVGGFFAPADVSDALIDLISPVSPGQQDNFQLGVAATVGYDNNVLYSSTNQIESLTTSLRGNLNYQFGTPRFRLRTQITANTTYYEERPGGQTDNNFGLFLGADYQYRPRISFRFDTFTQYLSQPNPQLIGSSVSFSGNYFTTDTNFFATYEFRPNISLVSSYNLTAISYEEETVNEQSGFSSQTFSLTANWLVTPISTLLMEYRYNPIEYYEADQGSDGQLLLFGITQTLSPRFEWTLRGGGEYRKIRSSQNQDGPSSYAGPFVEGEFAYAYRTESSVAGTLRFGTEPSGVSAVTIRTSFRVGLTVEHQFGQRLSGEASLFYQSDSYDQPGAGTDFTQEVYTGNLGLRYEFTPSFAAILRYTYLLLDSELPDSGYDRSAGFTGLEVTF